MKNKSQTQSPSTDIIRRVWVSRASNPEFYERLNKTDLPYALAERKAAYDAFIRCTRDLSVSNKVLCEVAANLKIVEHNLSAYLRINREAAELYSALVASTQNPLEDKSQAQVGLVEEPVLDLRYDWTRPDCKERAEAIRKEAEARPLVMAGASDAVIRRIIQARRYFYSTKELSDMEREGHDWKEGPVQITGIRQPINPPKPEFKFYENSGDNQ